jgi:DedD protein
VLLLAGLVTLPLVFETEPRPTAHDADARRAAGAVAAGPAVDAASPTPTSPMVPPGSGAVVSPSGPAPGEQPADPPADPAAKGDAGAAAVPHAPGPATEAPAASPPLTATAVVPGAAAPEPAANVPAPPAKPAPTPAATPAPATTATPPSTPASAPPAARYVVQVGAYRSAEALRDARQKVERLGLRTYTQVIDSDAGPRTRLRVGPFDQRAAAEAAAARLRAAGMPAALLTL